jgi:dodecin
MAVVKVSELLGENEQSREHATQQVVAKATRTLHQVTSATVKEFQSAVENGKARAFRVDAKVALVPEGKSPPWRHPAARRAVPET